MLRLTLIVTIAISLLLPAQREAPSVVGAKGFVSLEGRFSISLPDRNGIGPLTIPTPFGEAKGDLSHWETKEATFGVGHADAAMPLDGPVARKQFFDSDIERFNKVATSNNGTVAAVKQITLDKYPGIEQRVDLFTGSVVQRTYIVSRRVYEIVAVLRNSQRIYESVALGALDSFKVLSEAEVTRKRSEEEAKAEPSPLPQTPVAPRDGSDASDEGLKGRVKSVFTERQDLSGTGQVQERERESFNTYNPYGNLLRTEFYDLKGLLSDITVYGFIAGSRVAAFKWVPREYSPPPHVGVSATRKSALKTSDPRFTTRFAFKYDEKKRLIEKTLFQSNGDVRFRYVYKYDGSQKEEIVYSANGSISKRALTILDKNGNKVEQTVFEADGSVRSKESFTYEFDAKGNWTKQTTSRVVMKDGRQQLEPDRVHFRTITYY